MEYKKAEPLPALEVPPDLLTIDAQDDLVSATAPLGGTATLSEFSRSQQGQGTVPQSRQAASLQVGPKFSKGIALARDGAERWLTLEGQAALLWSKLLEFWPSVGLTVAREDPKIGIIETGWAENKGTAPVSSVFKKAFDVLYSSSTRDRYVMRVEPGRTPGTTEVYISHVGMQQLAKEEGVQWFPRESEPWLEDQMLKRLALYLGADETAAEQVALDAGAEQDVAFVQRGSDGELWLDVTLDFPRAWARLAGAIPRTNITIEDFDRNKGLFYVAGVLPPEEDKDPSWLNRFFKGYVEEDPVEFKIRVEDQGSSCRASVLDKAAVPNNSKRAERLLEELKKELR
jgi:outer membrane protein assembly factor BamC